VNFESSPPSIQTIIGQLRLAHNHGDVPEAALVPLARTIQSQWKTSLSIREWADRLPTPKKRVLNGTGIILHTGLGRSPLGEKIAARVFEAARGYINLEIDLPTGKRGARNQYLENLFQCLNPSYRAVVVNNGAAAILLALQTLKQKSRFKKAIISRGELVEIGGGFRVPEILSQSGLELVEVGTTNKTRLKDYEAALLEGEPGIILKVSQSCFHMAGFVEQVEAQDLIQLRTKFPERTAIVYDAGSLSAEQIRLLPNGFDSITSSCDKLLGGPQAGIILTSEALQGHLIEEPLYRAFRLDKLSLAALEACLELHIQKRDRLELPVSKMLSTTIEELASRFHEKFENLTFNRIKLRLHESKSSVGGGSWRGEMIASQALWVHAEGAGSEKIARLLRLGKSPVVGSIQDGKFLIDLRTVLNDEDDLLVDSLMQLDQELEKTR